jgi:hypothetical protein
MRPSCGQDLSRFVSDLVPSTVALVVSRQRVEKGRKAPSCGGAPITRGTQLQAEHRSTKYLWSPPGASSANQTCY